MENASAICFQQGCGGDMRHEQGQAILFDTKVINRFPVGTRRF